MTCERLSGGFRLPSHRRLPVGARWREFDLIEHDVDHGVEQLVLVRLYQPGEIDEIRGGRIVEFEINPTLMLIFFVIIAIPAMMVMLSMTLPARVNRATNLIVALLYIPACVFNVAGETSDWYVYYGLTIGVEVLILAFILRSAWTWARTATGPSGRGATGLRQGASV